MIFNEMSNSIHYGAVQESPYELGIGGALMHVWENEQNYNALMKAAALSEMKYYNETGGDLFVQEAGALSGFVEKAKALFKKMIEKIKSIAHKFMSKINQFTMQDKDFVKKYEKELYRKDLTDFEFTGYNFPLGIGESNIASNVQTLVTSVKDDGGDDSDAINDICEKNRGIIVGGSAMTESEFREELHEKLYGDKGDIKVNIREQLSIITNNKKITQDMEKLQKRSIKLIEDAIKELDKAISSTSKVTDDEKTNAAISDQKNNAIKCMNNKITVYKSYSNDLTVTFGAVTKALADKNRQAKAICVKALSYKHEAATLEGYAGFGGIFDGVEIM